jgi:deoxyribonuclease-1-like protein
MQKGPGLYSLMAFLALGLSGCTNEPTSPSQSNQNTTVGGKGSSIQIKPVSKLGGPVGVSGPNDTIKVASFNIQVFGTSKLNKPHVMEALARVVRCFDVVAIQEVRSTDDRVVPTFVQMINATGASYDFVIGPRLGRTSSKEQYAYIFNSARIGVDRNSVYTTAHPQDRLHREPLVARFQVVGPPADKAFTFSLVNIHTDPDETVAELNALANVFAGVQQNGSGEDDIILLGDLNVDDRHLGNLGHLPGIMPALSAVMTNTRRNRMYDNVVLDRRFTSEYTCRCGVFDLMTELNLTTDQALEISDHLPVWAEFRVLEGSAPVTSAGH